MSQFESVSSITNDTEFIILTKNEEGNLINAKASGSSVAPVLCSHRWVLPPPANSWDSRGDEGSESYKFNGVSVDYFIKSNGSWFKTTLSQF